MVLVGGSVDGGIPGWERSWREELAGWGWWPDSVFLHGLSVGVVGSYWAGQSGVTSVFGLFFVASIHSNILARHLDLS